MINVPQCVYDSECYSKNECKIVVPFKYDPISLIGPLNRVPVASYPLFCTPYCMRVPRVAWLVQYSWHIAGVDITADIG